MATPGCEWTACRHLAAADASARRLTMGGKTALGILFARSTSDVSICPQMLRQQRAREKRATMTTSTKNVTAVTGRDWTMPARDWTPTGRVTCVGRVRNMPRTRA